MGKWARKLLLFAALSVVTSRTFAQDLMIGTFLPCDQSGVDPDPNNAEDNFSCPILDQNILQCYSTAQLCDGSRICSGGSDEGDNLVALECDPINNLLRGQFACSPGIFVQLSDLCDGNRNCDNGDDETTTICESE